MTKPAEKTRETGGNGTRIDVCRRGGGDLPALHDGGPPRRRDRLFVSRLYVSRGRTLSRAVEGCAARSYLKTRGRRLNPRPRILRYDRAERGTTARVAPTAQGPRRGAHPPDSTELSTGCAFSAGFACRFRRSRRRGRSAAALPSSTVMIRPVRRAAASTASSSSGSITGMGNGRPPLARRRSTAPRDRCTAVPLAMAAGSPPSHGTAGRHLRRARRRAPVPALARDGGPGLEHVVLAVDGRDLHARDADVDGPTRARRGRGWRRLP